MTELLDITFTDEHKRKCGDCQLCCKLLPMIEGTGTFVKSAGTRCQHQRHGKGCNIYDHRPWCCKMWSCQWLLGADTGELRRPDRSHYVIDVVPDAVVLFDHQQGIEHTVYVVQVWCDPDYPDAIRDTALRDYMAMRAARDGMATMIRYSDKDAFVIFPPALSADREWHEMRSDLPAIDMPRGLFNRVTALQKLAREQREIPCAPSSNS
jgi:hypothetical protein